MIDFDMIPHFLKYMGSKRDILGDIRDAVDALHTDSACFCDLFAGTAIVSYAMSDRYNVITNDIQHYSSVFARTYFGSYDQYDVPKIVECILHTAQEHVAYLNSVYPFFGEMSYYSDGMSFEDFKTLEENQQNLLSQEINEAYSLFTRCYSGTYWSVQQCVWIDALRKVADDYKDEPIYYAILSSIIYAMSYASQSTGHFAQFRKITQDNYKNILFYRKKSIVELFSRKLTEVLTIRKDDNSFECTCLSLDYRLCLQRIPNGSIVYADPPYSNVHYSRFYHAVETLVRYDYPVLEYTGRYRSDRHQSPFDQATNVRKAFVSLFEGIKSAQSHLILSYSDNGMLTPDEVVSIGMQVLGTDYEYNFYSKEYSHMKMGRSDEYKMDVRELIISFKRS